MNRKWRRILQNLAWYLLAIILLAVLVYLRLPMLRGLLWAVAIAWGAALLYYSSRTLGTTDEADRAEERLQGYLDQALAYKAQIDQVIKAARPGERVHLDTLAGQVTTWTEAVQSLVERVSGLYQDPLIRRDRTAVPQAIADLETRLARETEPTIKTHLERTLANRRKQLAALDQLQHVLTRAEIQIESTLSMLGTMYSQILTGQSTSHVADYSRLSTDVDEEVRLLQDQLEALREVKLGRE